ncbi:MAG: amidohydrolase family protein, partial [Verrucomicrobiota bacterium]
MRSHSRREFLGMGGGGLAGGALSTGSPSFGAEPYSGWVDSHVHVWTSDQKSYPISPNFVDMAIEPETFPPEKLLSVQEGTGVERTVLIQMSFYEYENRYMLETIERFPGRFSGVAIVNHDLSLVDEEMKSLAERGVRGFRLYAFPDRVKDWEKTRGIDTLWKTAGETGQAVCCLTDPDALSAVRTMCQKYPETCVVIDH